MRSLLATHRASLQDQLSIIAQSRQHRCDTDHTLDLNTLQIDSLKAENSELRQRQEKITTAVEHLRLLNQNFQKQLQANQEREIVHEQRELQFSEQSAQLERLQTDFQTLQGHNTHLTDQNAAQTAEIAAKICQIDTLQELLGALQADVEVAQLERQDPDLSIQQLTTTLKIQPSGAQVVMINDENLRENFALFRSRLPRRYELRNEVRDLFEFVSATFGAEPLRQMFEFEPTRENLLEVWDDQIEELVFSRIQDIIMHDEKFKKLVEIQVEDTNLAVMMACDIFTALMLGFHYYYDESNDRQLMPDLKLPVEGGFEAIIEGWDVESE
ncbi:hypothetical protein SS50377_28260 [Spironucleus salmonicida]|uniref:Uncharacterized protein n=1 Tax=Spironucleus salmonicida TaxID=348837 RepID=V6LW13_9EUKA|nr:hypothetical protein SS50377_28260 [Spironucleus salmonicida]|eukprot:EST48438.1 Hypothetical protein SS50377_11388 [Spironucleus salmonicida]